MPTTREPRWQQMARGTTRRRALAALGLGFFGALLAPRARARPVDVAYEIRQVTRGAADIKPGRVALDLPEHSETGTSVPLTVTVDSPMTAADHVRAVHVLAGENPRPRLFSAFLTPLSGKAEVSTRIRLDGAQTVTAIAEMSNGSFWIGERYLTVAFGACNDLNQAGGEPAFSPVSRVAVPEAAAPGDVVVVRTLIAHPMETGLRLDHFNQWVPEHIVKRLTCTFNDSVVFDAQIYPGISTNPYFAFYFAVREPGVFNFAWQDNKGPVYTNSAQLKLGSL